MGNAITNEHLLFSSKNNCRLSTFHIGQMVDILRWIPFFFLLQKRRGEGLLFGQDVILCNLAHLQVMLDPSEFQPKF